MAASDSVRSGHPARTRRITRPVPRSCGWPFTLLTHLVDVALGDGMQMLFVLTLGPSALEPCGLKRRNCRDLGRPKRNHVADGVSNPPGDAATALPVSSQCRQRTSAFLWRVGPRHDLIEPTRS